MKKYAADGAAKKEGGRSRPQVGENVSSMADLP
jgi:hypothetical protein